MWLKIAVAVLALGLGMLSQFEVDDEVLISEKTVAVSATRAKAFQFLSDMRNLPKWYPTIVACEPIDMAPMSIGKHFLMTYDFTIYGETVYNVMISGYESPKYISYVIDDWLSTRLEMSLERRPDSRYPTALTWRIFSRNRSLLQKYIVGPMVGLPLTNEVRSALLSLRHQLQV